MILNREKLNAGLKHFVLSAIVAVALAVLIFVVWYPSEYREMSGGQELFFLMLVIDVCCGPILTMVVYNSKKPKSELYRDIGFIVLVQIAAMGYGVHVAYQARPVYMVLEVDRFKIKYLPELEQEAVNKLPGELQPHWTKGPILVTVRAPKNSDERSTVMFESVMGGRDYAERADFFVEYNRENIEKYLKNAKSISLYLNKYPDKKAGVDNVKNAVKYFPVIARKDWVALIDEVGNVQGFLPGDGFE